MNASRSRASRSRCTIAGTAPCGEPRSTGVPPSQRNQRPNSGSRNNEALPQKATGMPMLHLASTPMMKSQFDVCG